MTRELALLAVLLMLLEIAFRRLQLWGLLDRRRPPRDDTVAQARTVQERARDRKVQVTKARAPEKPKDDEPPPPSDGPQDEGLGGALSAARKRGKSRLKR